MKDKVCLITGATSGIGYETALALAKKGATVVLGGRDMEKASNAVIKIRTESNNPNVDFLLADLSDFVEVKNFANEFKKQYKRLDVLVNNAGAIFKDFDYNPQDIELTMALNLFSPYLLTGELLDIIQQSAPSRVINVSSTMHKTAKNDFGDFNNEKNYKPMVAYSNSKLGLIHYTYALAEKLSGTGVTVNAMHPGWVKSNFGTGFYSGFYGVIDKMFKPVQITPEKGAATIVYLATSDEVDMVSGKYFVKGRPVTSSMSSYNKRATTHIWNMCKEFTDFEYEIKQPEKKSEEKKEEIEPKQSNDNKPGGV